MVVPDWQEICEVFKSIYMEHTQERFPQDPLEQLLSAVQELCFVRGIIPGYHFTVKSTKIAHDLGTAVTVQEMVLAIVVLQVELALLLLAIRRQDTGGLFGEFLACAQGEDVVGGFVRQDRLVI